MSINLLQKYECGNCSRVFNDHELLCEDWRIKEKSIICPECKYYLEIPSNPNKKFVILALFVSFVLGALLAYSSGSELRRTLVGLLLLVALPTYLWVYGNPYSPVKTNAAGKSEI